MALPMMTVSGIRGIVHETIDESFICRIAYIQTMISNGGTIVVGRDTRPSGAALARAAFRGIRAAGGTPVDVGIAPTPTICLAVKEIGARSGIIVTASHNPIQYNGYKMVHSSGRLFRAFECEAVYSKFNGYKHLSEAEFKKYPDTPDRTVDAVSRHIEKILSVVDVRRIRDAGLHIAIDSINGAAGTIFPALLDALKVTWIGVNNKLDGNFVHNPEPRPEYLTELSELLKSLGDTCWGGFIFDPDADRLATMGEHGEPVSEEMTLAFVLQNLLGKKPSTIAVNLSTSMVIDDVASQFKVNVLRSKIGEANVVETMEKYGCHYGGEGNGGVIYPEIVSARDGLGGMALILELMASTRKKITDLSAQWPQYFIVKEKISCAGIDPVGLIDRLNVFFKEENRDLVDGLKIIRDYGWVHLRASNTEPIIRCYAEAKTEHSAKELAMMITRKASELSA